MNKEDLKPGDLIVAKVLFTNEYHKLIHILYMDASFCATQEYIYAESRRLEYEKQAQPWCFKIKSNSPQKKVISASLFRPDGNYSSHKRYRWMMCFFDIYREFRLKYEDFTLPVEPVCLDCSNYCRQSCFFNLKIS